MEHRYIVTFSQRSDDVTWTRDEHIALAREVARKLGIPNAESKPTYRVGRNSNTGEGFAHVEWRWEGLR